MKLKVNEKITYLACKKLDDSILFLFQVGEGLNTAIGNEVISITDQETYIKVNTTTLNLLQQGEFCIVIDAKVLHEEDDFKTSGDQIFLDGNGNVFLPMNG